MTTGAIPALRGFSRQILYTLHRLLTEAAILQATFHPEDLEDLAIFDSKGDLLEAIQIKAFGEPLTLSDLQPQKPDSFLKRAITLLQQYPDAQIKLVSYSPIGPELAGAWQGDVKDRESIQQKLHSYGYSKPDIGGLFTHLTFHQATAETHEQAILEFLQRDPIVSGQPERAYELLTYWIYYASEHQERLTHQGLLKRVTDVGSYLRAREAHHEEWFTTIKPIADSSIDTEHRKELEHEFHEGIAARYEHILANVDIVRSDKLDRIDKAFQDARVMIIHGASGQGKSTLAYRYLHDYVPPLWGFCIEAIQDRRHALTIAKALTGHADSIGVPMTVYVDVKPADVAWPELIRTLAQHRNLRVLVTIREEDWKRSNFSVVDFRFDEIALTFDQTEARLLYEALIGRQTHSHFLSFDEAWRRFEEGGPLLEFVYLVNQNESLRERLRIQINRIRDEIRYQKRSEKELELLRLVSVASAYGARIDLLKLRQQLTLPDLARSIELFEQEFLFRRSDDRRYVTGLHSIRSSILTELLTEDFLPAWEEVARECLLLIAESDLEIFLLHAFSRRLSQSEALLEQLKHWQPITWTGIGGVLRGLLWLGIKRYVVKNEPLLREIHQEFGNGWYVIFDWDIADLLDKNNNAMDTITEFLTDQQREKRSQFIQRQTTKAEAFSSAEAFLSSLQQSPILPEASLDWEAAAETTFWIASRRLDCPARYWLSEIDFAPYVDTLPIETLADLVFSCSLIGGADFQSWFVQNRQALLNRFRQATGIVSIEDDGETLCAHFLIQRSLLEKISNDNDEEKAFRENATHDVTMQKLKILRRLIPDRVRYGCQGYGHHIGIFTTPHDDTIKTGISTDHLPVRWATYSNAILDSLIHSLFRPPDWKSHALAVIDLRSNCLTRLEELRNALKAYFRHKKPVKLLHYLDTASWDKCQSQAREHVALPQTAVDEWGFVSEGSSKQHSANDSRIPVPRVLPLARYERYRESLSKHGSGIANFMQQILPFLVLYPVEYRKTDATSRATIQALAAEKHFRMDDKHLITHNLAEAWQRLPQLQLTFCRHFQSVVDQKLLEKLEHEEMKTLQAVWCLVYAFINEPERHIEQPEKILIQRFEHCLNPIRQSLKKEFRKLGPELRINILTEEMTWQKQPALWLIAEADEPVTAYTCLDSVFSILRSAMSHVRLHSLTAYALDARWASIVVVPTVRGRSLDRTSWRLPVTKFYLDGNLSELQWWDYVMQQIPLDTWEQTGLGVWVHPRLAIGTRYQEAVTTLYTLACHVRDFERLPDTDEFGNALLQEYLYDLRDTFAEYLQNMLDVSSEMSRYVGELTSVQMESRFYLLETFKLLAEVHQAFTPVDSKNEEIKAQLTMADVVAWVDRMTMVIGKAKLVSLLWAADVVENGS